MVKFSTWFRKERESKIQTQSEAARSLRLSGPTISRWESGTEPRASHLLRVQKWSGVESEKLLKIVAQRD